MTFFTRLGSVESVTGIVPFTVVDAEVVVEVEVVVRV